MNWSEVGQWIKSNAGVVTVVFAVLLSGCARTEYPNAVLIAEGALGADVTRLAGSATGHAVLTRGSVKNMVIEYNTATFNVTINGCEPSR